MFDREDIEMELSYFGCKSARFTEVLIYAPDAFDSPGSEEQIQMHRGRKIYYTSAAHFWVQSLALLRNDLDMSGFLKYAPAYSQCEPITESDMMAKIKDLVGSLKMEQRNEIEMNIAQALNQFQSAKIMYADWNEVALVWETTDEYIAFYWSTTA